MAGWNSVPLHVSYEVMGWFAFASWSISFYPQVILNFRRKRYHLRLVFVKFCSFQFLILWHFASILLCFVLLLLYSVVGLNFDFVLLNFTKHSSYLIYNASLYISSTVQKQYRNKYGQKEVCSYPLFLLKLNSLISVCVEVKGESYVCHFTEFPIEIFR